MYRNTCILATAIQILASVVVLAFSAAAVADDSYSSTYGSVVDNEGNISLPKDFQANWTFLGTWSVAEKDVEISAEASGHGAAALHNVYTQPGVAQYYTQNGVFPDGAVVIKELLKAVTGSMTTGTVSRGAEVEGWFVMVKDTEERFNTNPLWGDGWGWVLFEPDGASKTTNYKSECLGCHVPAKSTDWIYIHGYPVLRTR